jgi:hypothetical protein
MRGNPKEALINSENVIPAQAVLTAINQRKNLASTS